MADIAFNVAKGQVAYYASLPAAGDALVLVPLESSGLVADATMVDYDTLDAILAGTTNEQTTMGRKTLASVTVTVNDTDDRVDVDAADVVWTAATGNAVGAMVVCYDPTGSSPDTALVPLAKFDASISPDGSDVTISWDAAGLYSAT